MIIKLSILIFFLFFAFPKNAYAYLDPGTGSYLFQLLMATILGLSFSIKIFWKNVKNFFSGIFSKKNKNKTND